MPDAPRLADGMLISGRPRGIRLRMGTRMVSDRRSITVEEGIEFETAEHPGKVFYLPYFTPRYPGEPEPAEALFLKERPALADYHVSRENLSATVPGPVRAWSLRSPERVHRTLEETQAVDQESAAGAAPVFRYGGIGLLILAAGCLLIP